LEVELKIAWVLTVAVLMNLPWLAHAQGPGPYPGPSQGPGYPSPGYPPPGYAEAHWAQCQQLAQAEQEIAGRLQFTPPSPERAAMEQQLREIGAARQSCWPR
jgi:hypothetical protein